MKKYVIKFNTGDTAFVEADEFVDAVVKAALSGVSVNPLPNYSFTIGKEVIFSCPMSSVKFVSRLPDDFDIPDDVIQWKGE